MSKLVTSEFQGLRLAWAALAVASMSIGFWQEIRSLSWGGRAILIAAFAAFGAVETWLLPRLHHHAFATICITMLELAGMFWLASTLSGFKL